MVVDVWPYSGRSGGQVTDAEHELLWSAGAEGLLPGQSATAGAIAVTTSTRVWSVQPADYLIAGHVVRVDSVQSGTLAFNAGAARVDLFVVFVDRTTSPWTKGIGVRQGSPGGGRPAASRAVAGRWEVPLGEGQVLSSGVASLVSDWRPRILRAPITAATTAAVVSPQRGERVLLPSGRVATFDGVAWQQIVSQEFGPGAPLAGTGGFSPRIVNRLTVPPAGWDRLLYVSAGCFVQASKSTDTMDVRLFRNDVFFVAGGQHQADTAAMTNVVTLTAPPFLLAAGAALALHMTVERRFGEGTWSSSADVNYNHFDVLAVPVSF